MRKFLTIATVSIGTMLAMPASAVEATVPETIAPIADALPAEYEVLENYVAMSHVPAPPARPATFVTARATPKVQPVRVVRVTREPVVVPVRAPDPLPSKRIFLTVGTGF